MQSIRARSASAGWTIIAASTPSKRAAAGQDDLPAAALLGRRPEHDEPADRPAGPATAAASAAPEPAAAMTLCPQAWPMPGRASYSHSTAIVGPLVTGLGAEGRVEPRAPRSASRPAVVEDVGEQWRGRRAPRRPARAGRGCGGTTSTRRSAQRSTSAHAVAFRSSIDHGRTLPESSSPSSAALPSLPTSLPLEQSVLARHGARTATPLIDRSALLTQIRRSGRRARPGARAARSIPRADRRARR